jgi:MEDS: MEthanogen/methylotroph, DcmR Sensory domain
MSPMGHQSVWGFTDELPESAHVCLIYNSEEQRRRVVSAFLNAGLGRGEAVRYVVDEGTPEEASDWLRGIGVPVPTASGTDGLRVFKADAFYLREGRFEPREMIREMVPRFEAAERAGFTGVRSCGEMSWALKAPQGCDRLLEYESMLNAVETRFSHHGMCQYDARRFDGAMLFNVLRIHPYVVAQGQLVKNPFFVTPQEFEKA